MLKIETRPILTPKDHEVLIRVKEFGSNSSELFTRQDHSPVVRFPRVPGFEAVGIIGAYPSGELRAGDIVATAIGGMSRKFNGGYAECACVPVKNGQIIQKDIAEKPG